MTERPNKVDMISWIKGFTKWPHRMTGTLEGEASAAYTADVFQSLGLKEVAIESVPSVCHFTTTCSLNVDGESIDCFPANGTNRDSEIGEKVTAADGVDIVYLGRGAQEDFENVDVKGKIVVCDCFFKQHSNKQYMNYFEGAKAFDPEGWLDKERNIFNIFSPNDWPFNYLRASAAGAAGFVGVLQNFMDCNYYHEDYSDIVDLDEYMKTAGVWVSRDDGQRLKEAAQNGAKGSLHVTTIYEYKEALNVKGRLKGQSDDIILIHSHHDATCHGAVQDASGMSVVFALAKFFSEIPEEERKTDLMFLSTDSHYTDYEGHIGFIEKRKTEGEHILIDLAIEHLGKEMELDEENQIILGQENEARQFYVSNIQGLPDTVYELIRKYDLRRTMVLPVEHGENGEYKSGDVNSDAYDFNVNGIPVISLISAPMYIYHNSDDIDKVDECSLEPVANMFIDLTKKIWELH